MWGARAGGVQLHSKERNDVIRPPQSAEPRGRADFAHLYDHVTFAIARAAPFRGDQPPTVLVDSARG